MYGSNIVINNGLSNNKPALMTTLALAIKQALDINIDVHKVMSLIPIIAFQSELYYLRAANSLNNMSIKEDVVKRFKPYLQTIEAYSHVNIENVEQDMPQQEIYKILSKIDSEEKMNSADAMSDSISLDSQNQDDSFLDDASSLYMTYPTESLFKEPIDDEFSFKKLFLQDGYKIYITIILILVLVASCFARRAFKAENRIKHYLRHSDEDAESLNMYH